MPRKKNGIFNGNIKNPGEAIAVGIILIGGMALIYWFMLYGMWALSIKTKDELTVSTVAFNHCEIQDDAIQLYGDSEKCYIIPKYKRVMPDADEFLDEYQNGGTLILGYDKANDNVNLYVYTVEAMTAECLLHSRNQTRCRGKYLDNVKQYLSRLRL